MASNIAKRQKAIHIWAAPANESGRAGTRGAVLQSWVRPSSVRGHFGRAKDGHCSTDLHAQKKGGAAQKLSKRDASDWLQASRQPARPWELLLQPRKSAFRAAAQSHRETAQAIGTILDELVPNAARESRTGVM